MIKIKIEVLENFKVPENAKTKVTEMGCITEHMWMLKLNQKCAIKVLKGRRYVTLKDGVIHTFKDTSTDRTSNVKSIKRSLRHLRQTLNTNVIDADRCRWLTLTYAENMKDHTKIQKDFMNFNARVREQFGNYKYVAVREPQGRGAWHLHVVMIFDDVAPYIPNQVPHIYEKSRGAKQNYKNIIKHKDFDSPLYKAWGKGWVHIKSLQDVDNVGAYLTAYLCDMEVKEVIDSGTFKNGLTVKEIEKRGENDEIITKHYIKGARLSMYPVGMNLFTCSKGLEEPKVYYCPHDEAKEKVSSAKLTYRIALHLSDEETGFENILVREYYNAIRK